jgi:hypothetical protein
VYAPDAEISPSDMERLLVLAHPKSNGAPSAPPLLLERGTTPHGPVLRPAVLKAKDADPDAFRRRLIELVGSLTAKGIPVTARKLRRDYAADIGCPQRIVDRLVDEALAEGLLRPAGKGNGGGQVLVVATEPHGVEVAQ